VDNKGLIKRGVEIYPSILMVDGADAHKRVVGTARMLSDTYTSILNNETSESVGAGFQSLSIEEQGIILLTSSDPNPNPVHINSAISRVNETLALFDVDQSIPSLP
jgi:hypothetical protein